MKLKARKRDDENMMELFARFQAARHEIADDFVRGRIIRHSHYRLQNGVRPLSGFVFFAMADDFTARLIGELNRFVVNVHQADAWIRATGECEEKARPGLLWEFADPMLELSVTRPYSLKNQFIFAVVHLANQANSRRQKNWKDDLPPDKRINHSHLEKVKGAWNAFPPFLTALEKLNDDTFIKYTKNYRHLLQHRFRLQFGAGLTTFFDRQESQNGVSYTYRMFPPTQYNNLIPRLYAQHQTATEIFSAYWKLLKEFSGAWPTRAGR